MTDISITIFGTDLGLYQFLHLALGVIVFFIAAKISSYSWYLVVEKGLNKHRPILSRYLKPIITYGSFILIYSLVSSMMSQFFQTMAIFNVVSDISVLFLISHYTYLFFKSRFWQAFSFVGLSLILYTNKLEQVKPLITYLNQYSISLGSFHITPASFVKSALIILAFFWVSSLISTQLNRRIKRLKTVSSTNKEIISKFVDALIYFVAFLFVLNILGINLSTLTVIGGALGVGIGFGLQKITSNFISGIILLLEKSIQIDHLIEIEGGIYGFVKRLSSRYTLVETFDGKEVFIPNEDFITNKVTNWTFSNKTGRIKIEVGVSYKSDIALVKKLILEAASEHKHCLKDPAPKCYLTEFGDSSVNFLLLFFIKDVSVGPHEYKSDVMESIWYKFKEHNVEIPFPQRDLHIKSNEGIT